MAKGYWIVRVEIQATWKATNPTSQPTRNRSAGSAAKFLVRGGRYENPEGSSRERNAVIEFPSYQAAIDCWHSPDYQAALQLRAPVSTADLVIVEGYGGPQPGY